jgi:hypothetical protein
LILVCSKRKARYDRVWFGLAYKERTQGEFFLAGSDIPNTLPKLVETIFPGSHQQLKSSWRTPVMWIRIGLNADPDTAFDLNSDLDPEPGSKANADTCRSGTWPDFMSQKVEFLHEKYT